MKLDTENLNVKMQPEGCFITPSFISYLSTEGYAIDSVKELHTVPSESEKGKAYLVCKIETYQKKQSHPELDLIKDQITIPVCSCWSYRQNSSIEPPQGSCKHTRKAYREEKAKSDEKQTSLGFWNE